MLFPSSDNTRASMFRTALENVEVDTRKATSCTRFASKEVEEAILLAWKPVFDRVPQLADTLTFMVESLCQLESALRKVNETARSLEDLVRPTLLAIEAEADPAREGEEPAQAAEAPAPSFHERFEESWWSSFGHRKWNPDAQWWTTEPENPVDPA